MITLASVALTLTIGLISIAYGQTNQTKIPYLNCVYFYSENNRVTLQLNEKCDENQFNEAKEYYEANGQALITKEPSNIPEFITMSERLLNYCYEHADRPNPIQDLVDKKLIPQQFNGQTCESVKQAYQEMNNLMDFTLNITRGMK